MTPIDNGLVSTDLTTFFASFEWQCSPHVRGLETPAQWNAFVSLSADAARVRIGHMVATNNASRVACHSPSIADSNRTRNGIASAPVASNSVGTNSTSLN